MSDNEKYPNWGAFGLAPKKTRSALKPNISSNIPQRAPGEHDMRDKHDSEIFEWNLIESVRVGEKVFTVEYTEDDPPEMVRQALARRDIDVAKEAFRLPAAEQFKLTGERDVMSAVIEFARSQATDHNDLHSVWAALVVMARTPEKFAPLMGMTDDGTAVKFDNGKPHLSLFTKKNLKGRLERQIKARKSP